MSLILADYEDKKVVLAEFERRKKARSIAVTVDDVEIRAQLRSLNQPICLFGEGPADRRERLRQLLSKLGEYALKKDKEEKNYQENKDNQQTWYHEGPAKLMEARVWIAEYSIPRAKKRLDKMKLEKSTLNKNLQTASKQELFKKLRNFEILCSQIGDTRPISGCQFSPNNQLIATCSWSGLCKLWSINDLSNLKSFRGHNCNVGSIIFHPQSTLSLSPNVANLASCGNDGNVYLWSLNNEDPIGLINGHQPHRVSKLKFHPSGNYLATCCFDKSWRLFDLEYSKEDEILFQEGHSKPVYDLDFNSDGSLAVSGGLDSFGRVWDLRSGRCIMFMEGHLKGIISVNFSPDGYHIITGSEDHTAKIWNLRERCLEYTIIAHRNVISKVLFDKQNSNFVLTASYDNCIKLWSSPSWTPIQTLNGHENKVMCADISTCNKYIVSSSFDRTFKIWSPE